MVTWNGTRVTGPVLIYHDEIASSLSRTSQGSLHCRDNTAARVSWYLVDFGPISDHAGRFKQYRTGIGVIPSESILLQNLEGTIGGDESLNGLWSCRLSQVVFVGIYSRGEFQS